MSDCAAPCYGQYDLVAGQEGAALFSSSLRILGPSFLLTLGPRQRELDDQADLTDLSWKEPKVKQLKVRTLRKM